jgi:hypothetical protein
VGLTTLPCKKKIDEKPPRNELQDSVKGREFLD